jgi:Matrixin
MILFVATWVLAQQPDYCIESPYGVGARDTKPFICSRALDGSTKSESSSSSSAGGPSLNWVGRKATYRLNQSGTRDIAGTQEFAVIRQSFATWQAVSGGDFAFTDGGMTASERVGFDFRHLDQNENIVIFQLDWPHDENRIIGLTTTTYNAQTGEIFDADIELNDEYFDFTVGDDDVQTDLLNTLVHEVGHFIGFDHTDKDGSPIDTACASTATMSMTSSIGETAKRVLSPTDQMGMKFVYPKGRAANGFCNPPVQDNGAAPKITQVSSQLESGCRSSDSGIFAALSVLCLLRRRARR